MRRRQEEEQATQYASAGAMCHRVGWKKCQRISGWFPDDGTMWRVHQGSKGHWHVMTGNGEYLKRRDGTMARWTRPDRAMVRALDEWFKERARPYRVYINGKFTDSVTTERAAWDVIGRQPFGSGHEVRDADGNIRPEFIPL